MRLNAYLANTGVASRRGADDLIKAGRVVVNGEPGLLNTRVDETDSVELDGRQLKLRKSRYILLNNPAGYITNLSDPHGRRKVTDLIDVPERIVPVGRLDYDTTGALLLTNDGGLANKLMRPSFEVDKVYEVEVSGTVTNEILNKLSIGVNLDDGKSAPAKTKKISDTKIELAIHEGRNHQVKRMLAAVGLPVKKLHRSKYANLDLTGLNPGQWRELTGEELSILRT
jgi:23S rRNA pseudouridine2605 synthase